MSNSEGRLTDVLVETITVENPYSDFPIVSLVVWADRGKKDIFGHIPGVLGVDQNYSPTRYEIRIDRRYNPEWIKTEIIRRLQDKSAMP